MKGFVVVPVAQAGAYARYPRFDENDQLVGGGFDRGRGGGQRHETKKQRLKRLCEFDSPATLSSDFAKNLKCL